MGKTILVNADKCTGCKMCELVCSFHHAQTFKPSASRVKVKVNSREAIFTPQVCMNCEVCPPIEVCPVSAVSTDEETGVAVIDHAKCNLCRECIAACPYNAISFEAGGNEVIVCDRCGGDPECVKICFPEALVWAEAEEPSAV
ncbi:MAG: 4Fe-4S dicluster domain-containing protein [Chloroflexi bacterium]|nr:4Fe-4S dicluster domain-containing protein [Chloroflexota bacterium]